MAKGLRELAARTGFSIATVSRALNNNPAVTAKTRKAVVEEAERMGYAPSPAARALATRRSRTLGAVIPTLEHSIFSSFILAIEETLATMGYALVIATTGNDPQREHRRAVELMNMGAEGLILSGLVHEDELLSAAARRNVPVVCTSIFDETAPLPTIGYDNRQLGLDAARYLQGLGHRHIVVLHGPEHDNDRTRLRLAGAAEAASPQCRIEFVSSALNVSEAAAATCGILASPMPPSAILCLSDVLALGVMFQAHASSVTIPHQLSVMGFDNLEWAASAYPPLTTIRLPVAEMGQCAAVALVGHFDRNEPITATLLDGAIIERASTAAPAALRR